MVTFNRYKKAHPFPNLIQGFWWLENDNHGTEFQLVNDGYPEIIFVLKGSAQVIIKSEIFNIDVHSVVGLIDRPVRICIDPSSILVSVKLMPWALPSVIHDSASVLKNSVKALSNYHKDVIKIQLKDGARSGYIATVIEDRIFPHLGQLINSNNSTAPLLSMDILQLFNKVQNLSEEYNIGTTGSKRYFEKLYKEYVGVSPMKYRRLLKIKKATLILSNERQTSITGLAMALGYFDYSHFCKDFVNFTGITPSEFMISREDSPVLNNDSYLMQYEYS